MQRKQKISNSILWATAIVASALLHAPMALTIVLLPSLAVMSLLPDEDRRRRNDAGCRVS
ncbi:MAG: hypothetical protein WBV39_10220 [Rudaea sp.]